MKPSDKTQDSTGFAAVFRRDIQNYAHTNRGFLVLEMGVFLIAAITTEQQLPVQDHASGVLDAFVLLLRGVYPFTETRNGAFQLPLSWFVLLYLCVYTSLLYPVRDASGFGVQILVRTTSRKRWWASKCLALTVWDVFYFLVGGLVLYGFLAGTRREHVAWLSPAFSPSATVLLCLLPVLFGVLLSAICLCASLFLSPAWGQIIAISTLILIAFTDTPFSVGSYAMPIRCSAITPGGLPERRGVLLYFVLILLFFALGAFAMRRKDFITKREADLHES